MVTTIFGKPAAVLPNRELKVRQPLYIATVWTAMSLSRHITTISQNMTTALAAQFTVSASKPGRVRAMEYRSLNSLH
jgi:hypothetical protein